jgi:hypothetical protein
VYITVYPVWLQSKAWAWSLRHAMPRRSAWRVMQFDTLRLRLIKIAARVEGEAEARLIGGAGRQVDLDLGLQFDERLPRLVS